MIKEKGEHTLDDQKIIELYFDRDERAIAETESKYGAYCYRIAYNILSCAEDSEETVNDTYISAWNAIPPHRPAALWAFLGKITRRLSMNRLRHRTAAKRYPGSPALALEELSQCIPDRFSVADEVETKEVGELIDRFLQKLRADDRRIFICRYFYMESAEDIVRTFHFSRSKVYRSLDRTREKLRGYLVKEGVFREKQR